MVRRWAFVTVACALAGCLHDHYTCTTDDDCDIGTAGRCEADHHCTALDTACPTHRRYTAHSGDESGTCWAGQLALVNACAPDQAPAEPTGCAAAVCSVLPSCCATMWTDACVMEAQRRCNDVRCDTRLAITASRGARVDQWLASTSDGTTWTVAAGSGVDLQAYVGPAPGALAPRLATLAGSTLALDGAPVLALSPDHHYQDVTSADVARSLRDTLALSWVDGNGVPSLEVLDVASRHATELRTTSAKPAWGDYDHDAFPDLAAAAGGHYDMLENDDDGSHQRVLTQTFDSTVTGLTTPASPAIRSIAWADLDGDSHLDLAVFGDSIRVHLGGASSVPDMATTFDCSPPTSPPGVCGAGSGSNDTGSAAFSGAVLPEKTGASLLAATFPARGLYRIVDATGVSEVRALTLTGTTSPTSAIVAVVVRDLDGDHALDILAIDQDLNFYVALSHKDPTLTRLVELSPFSAVLAPPASGFAVVRTSTSGAPIP